MVESTGARAARYVLRPTVRSANVIVLVGAFWTASTVVLIAGIAALAQHGSALTLVAGAPIIAGFLVVPFLFLRNSGIAVDRGYIYRSTRKDTKSGIPLAQVES